MIIQPFAKSVRWSLLLCYGIDGFLYYDIIHASYTTLTYNEFVRNHVLPFCNPFPGVRFVLCIDNAHIHCSAVSSFYFIFLNANSKIGITGIVLRERCQTGISSTILTRSNTYWRGICYIEVLDAATSSTFNGIQRYGWLYNASSGSIWWHTIEALPKLLYWWLMEYYGDNNFNESFLCLLMMSSHFYAYSR